MPVTSTWNSREIDAEIISFRFMKISSHHITSHHVARVARHKQWEQDQAGMDRWLPLARRLSMSLGVGPLRSKDPAEQKTLQDLFIGFMKV